MCDGSAIAAINCRSAFQWQAAWIGLVPVKQVVQLVLEVRDSNSVMLPKL